MIGGRGRSDGREVDAEGCMGEERREREVGESVRVRKERWERDERESKRVKAKGYEICVIDGAREEINEHGRKFTQKYTHLEFYDLTVSSSCKSR